MQSGSLKHTISIQEITEGRSGAGAVTETWANVVGLETLRASIWPIKGIEKLESLKLEHEISHRVRIRYRSGVTSKMRIKFGARYLDIISPINLDEKNKVLEMICMEKNND
jgi:SPP1 family predicted phage head-tail adaptor